MGTRKTKQRPRKNIRRLSKTNRRYRKTNKVVSKNKSKNNKLKRYKYRGGADEPGVQQTDVDKILTILYSFFPSRDTPLAIEPQLITGYDTEYLIKCLTELNDLYNKLNEKGISVKNQSDGGLFETDYPGFGPIVGCILIELSRRDRVPDINQLQTSLTEEFIQEVYDSIDKYINERSLVFICYNYISQYLLPGEFKSLESFNESFKEKVMEAVTALELQLPRKRVQGVAMDAVGIMTGMTFDTAIVDLISDYRDIGLDSMITILEGILNGLKREKEEEAVAAAGGRFLATLDRER